MLIDERLGQYTAADDPHPVSVQRLFDRLRYHDLFKLFPTNIRESILKKAFYRTYQPGEIVYYRGDEDAFMGVVIR